MRKVLSLMKREFKLFLSNKIMKTLYIGGPVLYGILFGVIYAPGVIKDQPIVIVDKDHSPLSDKLKDMLEDNENITIKYQLSENIGIEEKFIEDGIQAAVIIPDFFERDVNDGRTPEIVTYINGANLVSSGYVNRAIFSVVATLNAITSRQTGRPAPAVQLNIFRLFNPASNYGIFVWPSYLTVILQSVILVVIALSFASEAEKDNFNELASFKPGLLRITFGKLSVYWIMACGSLLIYVVYFFLFKQSLPDHLIDSIVILSLFIAAISFQGMIAGLVLRSQLKVIQVLMIMIMPAYISSGYSWPFSYDGWPARIYSVFFPYHPFINGMRILLLEHGRLKDIDDLLVYQLIQLFLYASVATMVLRYRLRVKTRTAVNPVNSV